MSCSSSLLHLNGSSHFPEWADSSADRWCFDHSPDLFSWHSVVDWVGSMGLSQCGAIHSTTHTPYSSEYSRHSTQTLIDVYVVNHSPCMSQNPALGRCCALYPIRIPTRIIWGKNIYIQLIFILLGTRISSFPTSFPLYCSEGINYSIKFHCTIIHVRLIMCTDHSQPLCMGSGDLPWGFHDSCP